MKNEMLNEMKLDAILKNDKLSEEEKDQMINELFFSEDILPSEEDLLLIEEELDQRNFIPMYRDNTVVDIERQYAKEFGKIPLLSEEEEKELFTNISTIKELLKDDKDNKELNDKLRLLSNKAVEHNLRLVIDATRHFVNKGISYLDLVQEGNLGLIKAVEKYDISYGYRFSTYAIWWIRQKMIKIVNEQARVIRVPYYLNEIQKNIYRIEFDLAQELNRFPTIEEVAERFGITTERLLQIKKATTPASSIDNPIGEDKETLLVDLLEEKNSINNNNTKSTEEEYEQKSVRNILEKFLNEELPKEIYYDAGGRKRFPGNTLYVLKQRFGFNEEEREYTLTELSQELGVTPERVRQIEAKALGILSKPNNPLGNYLSSYRGVYGTPVINGKKPKRTTKK